MKRRRWNDIGCLVKVGDEEKVLDGRPAEVEGVLQGLRAQHGIKMAAADMNVNGTLAIATLILHEEVCSLLHQELRDFQTIPTQRPHDGSVTIPLCGRVDLDCGISKQPLEAIDVATNSSEVKQVLSISGNHCKVSPHINQHLDDVQAIRLHSVNEMSGSKWTNTVDALATIEDPDDHAYVTIVASPI
jgi:hypothetical protein